MSSSIHILSYNCWGLKFVSKNRTARIDALAQFLSTTSFDIVCLQELFVSQDFTSIKTSLENELPFSKLFHGGAVGQGLAVFSRWPIVSATVHPFSLNGHPLDKGADWFAGKGVASVLLNHPSLSHLQIFNTHFFSEGGDDGPEHKRAHRLIQAWEFAKLVKQSAQLGRYVIAAGDFNSTPYTLPMTVVLEHAGLCDSWAYLHPSLELPETSNSDTGIDPFEALSRYGYTYDSPLNSYASKKHKSESKRIDYVLFRNRAQPSSTQDSVSKALLPQLIPTEARVALTDLVPRHDFSFSDHFGVDVTFTIKEQALDHAPLVRVLPEECPPAIDSMAPALSIKEPSLTHDSTLTLVAALKTHISHTVKQGKRELGISFGCVTLLVLNIIGTGWSTKAFLTPVFVFVGAVLTWIATVMFNIGLLYNRWEISALTNVIEELELYLQEQN